MDINVAMLAPSIAGVAGQLDWQRDEHSYYGRVTLYWPTFDHLLQGLVRIGHAAAALVPHRHPTTA